MCRAQQSRLPGASQMRRWASKSSNSLVCTMVKTDCLLIIIASSYLSMRPYPRRHVVMWGFSLVTCNIQSTNRESVVTTFTQITDNPFFLSSHMWSRSLEDELAGSVSGSYLKATLNHSFIFIFICHSVNKHRRALSTFRGLKKILLLLYSSVLLVKILIILLSYIL